MPHQSVLSRCLITLILTGIAAQALTAAPWKFAVFCDGRTGGENGNTTGVNDVVARAIAAEVVKEKVSLVIYPGDLVNGNVRYGPIEMQFAAWKRSLAVVYDAKIPVYAIVGNHDVVASQDVPKGHVRSAWREAFPELPQNGPAGEEGFTYSVDFENACFIAADQFIGKKKGFDAKAYDSATNSGMISPWVISQVKGSKARWVFVFGHETAFIGCHVDCLANVPEERDALWDALGEKGGVYFAGHDHMYLRQVAPDRANRPVLTLVAGDAGAPPQPYSNSGLNTEIGRKIVPQNFFLNAKTSPDEAEKGEGATTKAVVVAKGPKVENTNGHPMYFGFVLITVDDPVITGEWRAFTNYDTKTSAGPVAPEQPKFETLDRFTWPAK